MTSVFGHSKSVHLGRTLIRFEVCIILLLFSFQSLPGRLAQLVRARL